MPTDIHPANISRIRQALHRLAHEIPQEIDVFMASHPMARGSVYETRRQCGKSRCTCAEGVDLHVSKVASWSAQGRQHCRAIPQGSFLQWKILTQRYRRFRRARARLVKNHKNMLKLIAELETHRSVQPWNADVAKKVRPPEG